MEQNLPWQQAPQTPDLDTDEKHEVKIQKEVIPLIFVPGIMGTRLRRGGSGTDVGNGPDGRPNLRWNPSAHWFREAGTVLWMNKHFAGKSGADRRLMLVGASGSAFNETYLEVANTAPVGDGWAGIMVDYTDFLKALRKNKWGDMSKAFEFPVYAFGYNWSDSAENAGAKLAARIPEIINEGRAVTGLCEKVILITHSMGGLVARAASELSKANNLIMGIVHGVQPATGSAAGYWRMKAGFEGHDKAASILGDTGPTVTPILGNIPGGLELLPNQSYTTNGRAKEWLVVRDATGVVLSLPKADPYSEIYEIPAEIRPQSSANPSPNRYWGLVDPELLDPDDKTSQTTQSVDPVSDPEPISCMPEEPDGLSSLTPATKAWMQYMTHLQVAKEFHQKLGSLAHVHTFCFHGNGHDTASMVEFDLSSGSEEPQYRNGGFRGFFTDSAGNPMQAVMQDRGIGEPPGIIGTLSGDGTVPVSSSTSLDDPGMPAPGNIELNVEHQPAYEDSGAQQYTIRAITALVKIRYYGRMFPPGDYPTSDATKTTV